MCTNERNNTLLFIFILYISSASRAMDAITCYIILSPIHYYYVLMKIHNKISPLFLIRVYKIPFVMPLKNVFDTQFKLNKVKNKTKNY